MSKYRGGGGGGGQRSTQQEGSKQVVKRKQMHGERGGMSFGWVWANSPEC